MNLSYEDHEQMAIMTLQGEFTVEDADSFRIAVMLDFVFDMSAMEHIDSRGLEELLWVQDQVADKMGQIRLVSLCEDVKTILGMTRMDNTSSAASM